MAGRKIVSVDREAAKEVVVEAGRKARKSVARTVTAQSGRALRRVLRTCIGLSKRQTAALEKLEEGL